MPHRLLTAPSCRHPSRLQDVFIGVAFLLHPHEGRKDPKWRDLEYTGVLHDGTGVIESQTFHMDFYAHGDDNPHGQDDEAAKVATALIERIRKLQSDKGMNIRVIAIAEPVPQEIPGHRRAGFMPTLWLHIDAIPFVTTPATSMFTKLPAASTQASGTSAVQAAVKYLHPASHSATLAEVDREFHEVAVDCWKQVKLCTIKQYEESTSPQLWKRFIALANHLRKNNVSISFFSATPQGGGVALMRHALVRLWSMCGVEAKWFVPEGHPTVFDITKRKIHNVLQGVAQPGVEISDVDKTWFELWIQQNYESFWSTTAGHGSVIVIDDPQLTAFIPIIRKNRPDAKIIFRSHIQIQSHLTDKPDTPQHRTWNYLYSFIKQTNLFLAHPVKDFVPMNVQKEMPVLYMAPSTDPLDGLNKPYGITSTRYFREMFNSLSRQQCGVTIDWGRIDVLLQAYLKFRQKLEDLRSPPIHGGPQLVIMGHGSVDDPDGTVIYELLHDILSTKEFELVKHDVAIVRAPPSDSILGCILQGAWVATQLSTREGFEVKVTEAINKRVPIIASDAGGIPLQVKHGKNGWIVPAGQSEPPAQLLFDLYQGKLRLDRPLGADQELKGLSLPNAVAESFIRDLSRPYPRVHGDENATSEDFWTVGNATRWMLLASRLLNLPVEKQGVGGEKQMADDEEALLKSMAVGKRLECMAVDEINVWQMVMGEDMIPGEGGLRQ